jgi:hypothetical protein
MTLRLKRLGIGLISLLMVFGQVAPAKAAYNDLEGHWAGGVVAQLTQMGVIRDDSESFLPESLTSRETAVDWIVHILHPGDLWYKSEQALLALPANTSGITPGYEGSVALALQSGILTLGDLGSSFTQAISRQEALVWLCRAFGVLPDMTGTGQYDLSRFYDAALLDPVVAPYIVSVVREGILAGSGGYLGMQNPIKRGEFASLLNRFNQRYTPGLQAGVAVTYRTGRITGILYPNSVTIQNMDNTQATLAVASNSLLLKNGFNTALSFFSVGETVTYRTDAQNRLVDMTSSAVSTLPVNPWTTYRNTYLSTSGNWVEGEIRTINVSRGEIDIYTNDGGKRFYADAERFERSGTIYYFDNLRLRIGDEIRLYYTGTQINAIQYLGSWTTASNVISSDVDVYQGELERYDSGNERIYLQSGTVRRWNGSSWGYISGSRSYTVSDAGIYDYDGTHMNLRDLRSQLDETVYILYDNEEEEVLTVRISAGTQTSVYGRVQDFNRDELQVGSVTAFADYTAFVVADGALYDIEDIEEDDQVRMVYIRSGGENYAVLIELSSRSSDSSSSARGEQFVYQGEWDDLSGDWLTLRNVRSLDDGSWRSRGTMDFDLSYADCYYDGDELDDIAELSRSTYQNKTFYVLTDSSKRVTRVIVSAETTFRSDSGEVETASSSYFEMERSGREYDIESCTIMFENGNSLNSRRVYAGDEVYVVYERDGSSNRALIVERLLED